MILTTLKNFVLLLFDVKRVLYKFQIFISHPNQTSGVIFYYFNQLLTINYLLTVKFLYVELCFMIIKMFVIEN